MFCGAGVPDEHNDANPTHNVNTHTHTLASAVQQSQKHLRPLQASLLIAFKVLILRTRIIGIKYRFSLHFW